MKEYLLPFLGAFIIFAAVFYGLDLVMMSLQGLPLSFQS